ncbi:hypothetical protein [Actinoallomurus rhizosphaericola]|uniref:hypothetical protein n=1 Tax=Actinoallomurus rhizosphaericola TaxID=2952536 RepID=UPI00209281D2|nr:hypothetical protein [Actinoallomurus rhizosphaericola]MCO5998640.1 hypothetical protein [Actinoallomurus rhizosphaericola]
MTLETIRGGFFVRWPPDRHDRRDRRPRRTPVGRAGAGGLRRRLRRRLDEMGLSGVHFHDLRHTGNTLAAQSGASLADLKARMGQDSDRAALIYQHATRHADHRIAEALDARIKAELPEDDDDGPAGGLLVPVA